MNLRKSVAKVFRAMTGRISHEDLADLKWMTTHDFFDDQKKEYVNAAAYLNADKTTWNVRIFHGRERGISFSNPGDLIGEKLPIENAVALLDKFETDKSSSLRKCFNGIVNLPLPGKVSKALAQKPKGPAH